MVKDDFAGGHFKWNKQRSMEKVALVSFLKLLKPKYPQITCGESE